MKPTSSRGISKILRAALIGVVLIACATSAHAQAPALGDRPVVPKTDKKANRAGVSAADIAAEAKAYDDAGGYERAAATLRELRERVKPDLDLDVALALDEARIGRAQAAWELLTSPAAVAAEHDTMPLTRRTDYPWNRERLWTNGTYDGWTWYLFRARAEIAAARGQWDVAHENARACVAARPLAGKEWLILAVSAGHLGDLEGARAAALKAYELDPTLPEAHYVAGLLAWRAGRRAEAQERFRTALSLDSTYAAAGTALVRSRLPFAKPDSLPVTLLAGARASNLLTSTVRPKIEEFVQMDIPAVISRSIQAVIPDSLRNMPPIQMTLPVLVDARGYVVSHELPWFEPARLPLPVLSGLLTTLPMWRFNPALRHNQPMAMWTAIPISLQTGKGTP